MYIDSIVLQDFRTFRKETIDFVHPDQVFENGSLSIKGSALPFAKPKLNNINLVMGDNGTGKTTLLKAIAFAALGPAVSDAQLPVYRLIRREPRSKSPSHNITESFLDAKFKAHVQDAHGTKLPVGPIESRIAISRIGDIERVRWAHADEKPWHPIYSVESDAYFFVGYGVTRRVESREVIDPGARQSNSLVRAQRIRSLFEESYSLVPLSYWLPLKETELRGRFKQVQQLINQLLKHTGYTLTGERELGEYVFEKGGMKIPFPALSDGYRAYLGWLGDLLYHVCQTCPLDKKLVENRGVVMVDEIDLHLHPRWQMTVLETLSKAMPNLQFIFTSHSPLLVGSLEWMNVLLIKPGREQNNHAVRVTSAVHGLDADQILLSEFFGLASTRAPGKSRRLKELALKARNGDSSAALILLEEMSKGSEG